MCYRIVSFASLVTISIFAACTAEEGGEVRGSLEMYEPCNTLSECKAGTCLDNVKTGVRECTAGCNNSVPNTCSVNAECGSGCCAASTHLCVASEAEMSKCGDGICDNAEGNCVADCNTCGDGKCEVHETAESCAKDCADCSACDGGRCEKECGCVVGEQWCKDSCIPDQDECCIAYYAPLKSCEAPLECVKFTDNSVDCRCVVNGVVGKLCQGQCIGANEVCCETATSGRQSCPFGAECVVSEAGVGSCVCESGRSACGPNCITDAAECCSPASGMFCTGATECTFSVGTGGYVCCADGQKACGAACIPDSSTCCSTSTGTSCPSGQSCGASGCTEAEGICTYREVVSGCGAAPQTHYECDDDRAYTLAECRAKHQSDAVSAGSCTIFFTVSDHAIRSSCPY